MSDPVIDIGDNKNNDDNNNGNNKNQCPLLTIPAVPMPHLALCAHCPIYFSQQLSETEEERSERGC